MIATNLYDYLISSGVLVESCDSSGNIWIVGGGTRQATAAELLGAGKVARINAINTECRARLLTRFGDAAEQVSRSIGVYGATEKAALETGIAAAIDASNTASNAVLAAADLEAVEAVTVAWPVI